jgi:hypothetical protein
MGSRELNEGRTSDFSYRELAMAHAEPKSGKAGGPSQSHIQDLLDEALIETFPASDPIAVSSAEEKPTGTHISDHPPDYNKKASRKP